MNLYGTGTCPAAGNLPRTHGDEPEAYDRLIAMTRICPVCTGMNRRTIACLDRWSHLPRMHGDMLAALAGNQRILGCNETNSQIEHIAEDGQILFLSVFFDQKVLSAKTYSEKVIHTDPTAGI